MTQPPGVGEPGATGTGTPSSAGPPAPDHPYPAPPPEQPPPAPTGISGLAIASLVLALVGLGPIGLVLGIVALVRIRRSGQRGSTLAWVGVVLSILSVIVAALVVFALVNVVRDATETPRDEAGKVTATANARTADLQEGDCVTGLSEQADAEPKVVPCDQKYEAEVFAVFELPGDAWPGDAKLKQQADAECAQRFKDSGSGEATDAEIWYLYPSTEVAWTLGQRSITCLTAPSGP